jgi:hypothetical protein
MALVAAMVGVSLAMSGCSRPLRAEDVREYGPDYYIITYAAKSRHVAKRQAQAVDAGNAYCDAKKKRMVPVYSGKTAHRSFEFKFKCVSRQKARPAES